MSLPSRHRRLLLAIGFGVAAALPVRAGEAIAPKGVVELFTSQGCASCPPADEALQRLVEDGDVVALAYHVDYWNYLGWVDTLASKEHTARQYGYAKALKRNGVYTPQAVLNGRDHVNGADLAGIRSRIDTMRKDDKGLAVRVVATLDNDEIVIAVGPGQGKASVVVVYFDRQQVVDIETGENGGKRMVYANAVRDVQTIGMWNGKPATFVLPASVLEPAEGRGCAILLQKMKNGEIPGPILGATILVAKTPAN